MAILSAGEAPVVPPTKPVLTIGTFDGVHLGHQLILEEVKRYAAAVNGTSMVITFEPHPRQILQPDLPMQILTPLAEKKILIQNAGIQHIDVTSFTSDFARLSAAAYIEAFLVEKFKPTAIVIGYDHHFGHDRKGNIALLKEYGAIHGFEVHEIPAHMVRDAAISSTRIRNALSAGDVGAAAQMLGRPYAVSGIVITGQRLGRTIGYPTANIAPTSSIQLIPAHGVYAVQVSIADERFGGMLSIGTRPTVSNDGSVSIEVYLFDFDQDIYGQEITVHFVERMRDELKFDSLDALKEALQQDEVEARGILDNSLPGK